LNFHDPLADRIHNGDCHAVARLLVKLGVGIDGSRFIKHIIGKALQPPALTGRQLADSSAAERKRRAVFRFALIRLLCSLDGQSVFAEIAGAEINAVLVLRIQTKGGFAARLEAPSVLPLVFSVGGEGGTVVSDWWARADKFTDGSFSSANISQMIRAQNDLYMVVPDATADRDDLMTELKEGGLSPAELQRSARRIFRFIMRTQSFKGAAVADDQTRCDFFRRYTC